MGRFRIQVTEQIGDIGCELLDRQKLIVANGTPDASEIECNNPMVGREFTDRMGLPNVQRKSRPLEKYDR
jgi:hypothetical protein